MKDFFIDFIPCFLLAIGIMLIHFWYYCGRHWYHLDIGLGLFGIAIALLARG